jgi:two-component system cell cycle sensor histidine kinase/response regulator CckA
MAASKSKAETHRKGEQDYAGIFESAPDALILITEDGTIVEANRRAAEMLGYEHSELVGTGFPSLVAPEQHEDAQRQLKLLIEGKPVEPTRRVYVRKDGSRVPGEHIASAIKADDSEKRLFLFSIRDIQSVVHDEQQRVEQSQRLESLGRLASGIAHDFNNILASIIGFAELAKEDLPTGSDAARDLERSLKAADQAKELVGQILAFGRRHDDRKRPVDTEQVLVEIMRLIRSTFPPDVDLQFNSDHSASVIMADRSRIQQVVLNLCGNAGKAMKDTGGTVRIRVSSVDLSEEQAAEWGLKPGGYSAISVLDDGPGVPEELRDWIFEPFFTTRQSTGGSGLGLAVVKSIVEDHGGAIRLEPSTTGAHFRVLIPRHDGPVEEVENEPTTLATGSETILVLDDEPTFTEILTRILQKAGYSVMVSNDPHDALQLVNAWGSDLDLIITDQSMPDMTGMQFLERVKGEGYSIPAIVISGMNEQSSPEERAHLGVRAVIRKPVHQERATRIVRQILDGA